MSEIVQNRRKTKMDRIKPAANMGFGVMAALRIYPDRYNITQRHINLTNKAQQ